jgi:hypothetical protein
LTDTKAEAAARPLSNMERLKGHLKPESLAARLAGAWANPVDAAPQDALKKQINDRLNELRRQHAGIADPED